MAVQVAVVGLGRMGQQHAIGYSKMDGVSLVAGVDVDASAREQFESEFRAPAYESVEEVVDDLPIDAVSIVTPHTAHFEQALTTLEAGVATFVEKPLTVDPDKAEKLVEAANEQECPLGVGYQRRYVSPVQETKRRLMSGDIGVPRMVSCHLAQNWLATSAESWRTDPELSGGGLVFDTGSHMLEKLLWLLEGTPTQVAVTADDRGSR
ncbi:Gfo/Idh/MocA family protein [Halorussus caseinilyticus]|uniref:Gfo/Idh/MocA family protein n=1 Tax=Halorussus caseinilyticus TaxID=3034025 RepID=A0ABD5WUZ4_9EURY